MLKIPKKVEYAFLALKYIAEHSKDECLNTRIISDNADIPYDLTAKILQKLVKGKIVSSLQGSRGGYVLNINPEQLNLSAVINAVDDEVMLTKCMFEGATRDNCERIESCCLRDPLNRIQVRINQLFENTYLQEIIG